MPQAAGVPADEMDRSDFFMVFWPLTLMAQTLPALYDVRDMAADDVLISAPMPAWAAALLPLLYLASKTLKSLS